MRVRVRVLRETVLDGGVLSIELAREVGLGDHGVMGREVIALVAKGADPDLRAEVHSRERVEDGRAGLASKRRVRERWDVRVGTDRRNGGRKWDHALARLHLGARPDVPRHPHSVETLRICARHLRHLSISKGHKLCRIKGIGNGIRS